MYFICAYIYISKVNKFKLLLEKRKDAASMDKMVATLTEAHEKEKKAAFAQFEEFQRKAKEKEYKSLKDFKAKTNEMKKNLDIVTNLFQEKLNEFSTLEKNLKNKLSKVSADGNSAVQAKQEELDQYIKDR